MRIPIGVSLFGACLPVVASGGLGTGAGSVQARGALDVAIVIPAILEMRVLDQPNVVAVSASDAQRGEVSIAGSRLAVLANDRRGYVLEARLDGPFVGASIEGLAAPVNVTPEGARVLMPSMVGKARPRPVAILYRLRLREGTPPGTYPWPVMLSIRSP